MEIPLIVQRSVTGAPFFTSGAYSDLLEGDPVFIDPSTHFFRPADAAFRYSSFVIGLVMADTRQGFECPVRKGPISRLDWSSVTGNTLLTPGAVYFLKAGGGLSPIPPTQPSTVTIVGYALDTNIMNVVPSPPIQL
jgi:hypothetical protein